tara:strand:+ start:285 stop:1013 length:729 start_codon:yes stop_codon:yes gene_type:complete
MDYASIDFLTILCVIIFFTVIQSIFGVGLLVFGTPTLLLLDYTFYETLSYLLPSSIIVSLLQMRSGWVYIRIYKKAVIQFILPTVALGLVLVVYLSTLNLHLLIGFMLLLTFIVRFFDEINIKFETFLGHNFRFGFLVTGFIHGLTNLGGASLVMITNALYNDKKEIQANIAYAYLFMAISQLIVLILTSNFIISLNVVSFPFISGIIYVYLGSYIFNLSSDKFYYDLMSFFILIYGLLLIS